MNFSQGKLKWITALVMTATLVGCSPNAGTDNAANQANNATNQMNTTANNAGNRAQGLVNQATNKMQQAGTNAGNQAQNMTGKAGQQLTGENATVKSRAPHVEEESNVKNTPAEKNPNKGQISDIRQPQVSQRSPNVGPQPKTTRMAPKEMANFIAQSVNRVPGVERSAVFVSGNTALVGIDLKADIGGSRIDTIKYAVKEAAENSSPNGMRAIVPADVDTVTRLRDLVAGTRQGRPIDSLGDEIADIISRLIPEV